MRSEIEQAARQLRATWQTRVPGPLLSAEFPSLSLADAYQIQLLNVKHRVESGRAVRGFKVGLTNRATQTQVGVNEPDYGHLHDDFFFADGCVLSAGDYCFLGIEPEIAFFFRKPLIGPRINVADVLDATDFVLPSLEVVDSRVRRDTGHRFTIVDTVADNGGAAGVVLAGRPVRPADMNLRDIGVVLRRNGAIVDTGSTGAVLGHPAVSIAWLANKLSEFETQIEAGHVVLSGSCTQILRPLKAGDMITAQFDELGSVSARFV